MKHLTIAYTDKIGYQSTMKDISSFMDLLEKQIIDQQPWPEYVYRPSVQFAVAHSGNCVFLQYDVKEKFVRSENTAINSSVWEDSCVEFFLAFNDRGYYNFEFNCIGTPLLGYGKNKQERELLPEEIIRKINIQASMHKQENGNVLWKLTVAIPVEVFIHDELLSVEKKIGTANFYKCGDLLPDPHFLAWNDIQNNVPDFHLPEFFGEVFFEQSTNG